MHPTDTQTSTIQLTQADKHFLFRCEQSWFSVPAITVREVTVAPDFVTVPGCHSAVEGLCRQQSEFFPVISLAALLDLESSPERQENNQLLTLSTGAVWAIRIAEAVGLEHLDTIPSPDLRTGDCDPSCILGTTAFGEHVIRVLNPERLYQQAQHALEDQWNGRPLQSSPSLSLPGDEH